MKANPEKLRQVLREVKRELGFKQSTPASMIIQILFDKYKENKETLYNCRHRLGEVESKLLHATTPPAVELPAKRCTACGGSGKYHGRMEDWICHGCPTEWVGCAETCQRLWHSCKTCKGNGFVYDYSKRYNKDDERR